MQPHNESHYCLLCNQPYDTEYDALKCEKLPILAGPTDFPTGGIVSLDEFYYSRYIIIGSLFQRMDVNILGELVHMHVKWYFLQEQGGKNRILTDPFPCYHLTLLEPSSTKRGKTNV